MARIQPTFAPPTLAATGESVVGTNYFETIKEIKDSAKKGQLSVLYVFNSKDGSKVKKFERSLFQNEDLGVALKVFRRLGIDVSKDKVAAGLYGAKVPRFIAFNAKGQQAGEVYLQDYRSKAGDVMKLLVRASKGHGKMPLKTFVKKYRSFLNELDQIEGKKGTVSQKKARLASGGSRSKMAKVQKDEQAIAKKESTILAKEKKLLAAVNAFDADPAASKKKASAAAPAPAPGGS